ncbi:MAG: FAD-dependent oxidoreductase [Chloroflexota bacterium]
MAKVVIVGGGYAGTGIAKALDADFEVTLIDKGERFVHSLGGLRAAVQPNTAENILIPYNNLLQHGAVTRGTVVDVTPDHVQLADNTSIAFDYLVLATGSQHRAPGRPPHDSTDENLDFYRTTADKIASAQSVLIVGGGAVGTELAGEILAEYPNKSVTLVHNERALLSDALKESLRQKLHQQLTELGAKVILNARVDLTPEQLNSDGVIEGGTFKTDKGEDVSADLTFLCLGARVNTSYLAKHFSDQLDERGFVKVNTHLQMEGYPNIFVAGDIPNVKELKLAANTDAHASVVSENIKALAAGQPLPKTYNGGPTVSVVTLGNKKGAGQLPPFGGLVVGAWATRIIKGGDLFTKRYRKELGQGG